MPSNNSKYTEEFREQTAKMILETGKSATSTAEEMGIDTNTVCRWVRDYRRKHGMPSYAEEKGLVQRPPKDAVELKQRIKELETKVKEKEKIIAEQAKKSVSTGEDRNIKKIPAHLHATTRMKYEAIRENMALFEVKRMCEALGVRRSNYYRWLKNQNDKKEQEESARQEIKLVEEIFESSDRIWGYRNIYQEIQARGIEISEYRVRKIMRENGFYPELAVKYKPPRNGKADGRYYIDKVQQKFEVKEKNQIWAGDITYIKTAIGWVYLASVIDLFNREVIGYAVSKQINTELVKQALGNAIGRRGVKEGLIFHSDRGSQYASKSYQSMLEENGITGSMSRPGCPYDNAWVESFFASLKKEKIYRRKYDTMEEVGRDVFWYIEVFYNRKRRHSTLQYMTPIE